MSDYIGALVALLSADASVAALAGARVFGNELPAAEAASMPRHAVVIRPAGGVSPVGGFVEITAERFDAISWGETPYQANRLASAVFAALKRARRQVVSVDGSGVLVHWIENAGGRLSLRDAETDWPAVTQPYQVMYSLKAAA